MRGYLRDVRSYLPPVQIGEVRENILQAKLHSESSPFYQFQTMRGLGIGVVIEVGKGSTLQVGDMVTGAYGGYFSKFLPGCEFSSLCPQAGPNMP